MAKTVINLILTTTAVMGTLAAFGGATWLPGPEPLIKRITRRGWASLALISAGFLLGIVKEIRQARDDKASSAKVISADNRADRLARQLAGARRDIAGGTTLSRRIESNTELQQRVLDSQSKLFGRQLAQIDAQAKLLGQQRDVLSRASSELSSFHESALQDQRQQAAMTLDGAGPLLEGSLVETNDSTIWDRDGPMTVVDRLIPGLPRVANLTYGVRIEVEFDDASHLSRAFAHSERPEVPYVLLEPSYKSEDVHVFGFSRFESGGWEITWQLPAEDDLKRSAPYLYKKLNAGGEIMTLNFFRNLTFDTAAKAKLYINAHRNEIYLPNAWNDSAYRRADGAYWMRLKSSDAFARQITSGIQRKGAKFEIHQRFSSATRGAILSDHAKFLSCVSLDTETVCSFVAAGSPTTRPWPAGKDFGLLPLS